MYIDSESELRKIGSQAKKFVLKDFAGKFGALFFIGCGYKIDAPIWTYLFCLWAKKNLAQVGFLFFWKMCPSEDGGRC